MPLTHSWTIVYVEHVPSTLEFFEGLGMKRKFLHESNQYGELESSAQGPALAFASWEMLKANMGDHWEKKDVGGFELAFSTDDVAGYLEKAISAGATKISDPKTMPWGQTVAYVRSPQGILIEICTPQAAT